MSWTILGWKSIVMIVYEKFLVHLLSNFGSHAQVISLRIQLFTGTEKDLIVSSTTAMGTKSFTNEPKKETRILFSNLRISFRKKNQVLLLMSMNGGEYFTNFHLLFNYVVCVTLVYFGAFLWKLISLQ